MSSFGFVSFGACLPPQAYCHSTSFNVVAVHSNNQFRLSDEVDDDLFKTFTTRLKSIGEVIALLDTWRSPEYLRRKWCKSDTFIVCFA